MKKVIKLSEEKLGEIISLIMEQVKLEDYEEEEEDGMTPSPRPAHAATTPPPAARRPAAPSGAHRGSWR